MDTEYFILCNSKWMSSTKEKKYSDRKNQWLPIPRGQKKGWTDLGHKKNLPYLIVVIDKLLCTLVKIHQNIHLELITLVECKLRPDEVDQKANN